MARRSGQWTLRGGNRAVRLLGRPGLYLLALSALAHAVPGVALFVYLQYLLPGAGRIPRAGHADAVLLVLFVAYLVVVTVVGALGGLRAARPVLVWLSEDRPADEAEQRAILRQPITRGLAGFCYWAGAAVVFGVALALLGAPAQRIEAVVVGILLAAISASSLSALLIERFFRPVARAALADGLPPRPFGIRVLPRLLLSWAFGSGVPLVGLLLAPTYQGGGRGATFVVPLVALSGAGLVSGFLISVGAARAVAEPLGSIRAALARVERGDLSVDVPVDDASEIGQLQAGVNSMVAGLRQRRQLEELFGHYVGAEVARDALERGFGRGERVQATVLFVDMVGSTAMAATLPPEEVVGVLNAYFAAVVRTVQAEGGWVNKFEGDGALCVFGPPVGTGDHAAAALRAGIVLDAALRAEAELLPQLVAAIGISTGDVVAGTIGSAERFEYTVIGDPVNEAARLTELAKSHPGRLLASGDTVDAGRVGGWQAAGDVLLRGRTRPTCLYEPIGDPPPLP